MNEQWQCQLRLYLSDEAAEAVRSGRGDPALQPLTTILGKHGAAMVSQLDAFESYVVEAETAGSENFPLYKWTKATLDDPGKRAKHAKAFALRLSGQEVYPKDMADALEADLQPIVGSGPIERMSRHDTNPANNLVVPPEYRG